MSKVSGGMLLKPTAGAEGTRQAFAGLQPQCCVSVHLPQVEKSLIEKSMRSSEKLIFRATDTGRVMKIGSEGKGLSYQPQALANHTNGE